MQNKRRNFKAFTLIELLVVIAIIALLLSILMPTLGKVKEIGRSVVCRTNMKQLGLATLLWSDDNGGWALPALWDRGTNNGDSLLLSYLGDPETGAQVMNCPSAKKYEGKTYDELGLTAAVAGLANGGNYYNSYGYNFKLCSDTSRCPGSFNTANDNDTQWGNGNVWWDEHGNCKLLTVREPSTKIMFAESILYISDPYLFEKVISNPAFNDPSERGRRHFAKSRKVGSSDTEECGKMNITWIDGSVSIEPDDIETFDGYDYDINGKYWYGSK